LSYKIKNKKMKYKCNECEHVFEGSTYTTECKECNNTSISVFDSDGIVDKIKKWIRKNRLIFFIILVIFILLVWPKGTEIPEVTDDDPLTELTVYSLDFDFSNKNFCIVSLKDSNDSKIPYSEFLYDFLNLKANIISDENDYKIIIVKNKIEYCTEGNLSIEYIEQSDKLTNFFQSGSRSKAVDPVKFDVKSCIENVEILGVGIKDNNCVSKIVIQKRGGGIMISVNGKDGKYKESTIFNFPSPISDFEVWFHPIGHPNLKEEYTGDLPKLGTGKSSKKNIKQQNKIRDNVYKLLESLLEFTNNPDADLYGVEADKAETTINSLIRKNVEYIHIKGEKCHISSIIEKLQIKTENGIKVSINLKDIKMNDCNKVEKINIK